MFLFMKKTIYICKFWDFDGGIIDDKNDNPG
jgi:hypothetical protein